MARRIEMDIPDPEVTDNFLGILGLTPEQRQEPDDKLRTDMARIRAAEIEVLRHAANIIIGGSE